MISVVIPALNAERWLPATLGALVPAAVEGLVKEVIVADGGSNDATRAIADLAGADVISSLAGRGRQLAAGAAAAKFPWLLFLHADTFLEDGWIVQARRFMQSVDEGRRSPSAAAFQFQLDDRGLRPRLLEALVGFRCSFLGLPYGDQGLLIPRRLFDEIGGYKDLPIMEDVEIVRRLGRKRLQLLQAAAVTSADRYRRDGYVARSIRNQLCLALYFAGLPVERVAQIYTKTTTAS